MTYFSEVGLRVGKCLYTNIGVLARIRHSRFGRRQSKRVMALVGFLSLLTACGHVPEQEGSITERAMDDIREATLKFAEHRAVPARQAALSAAATTQNNSPLFNVSVNQLPARTFFLSLISDAGVNVVAHPDISGAISLELKNVGIRDVLDVTREVYGYEYKFANNIYTIFPRKLRTEVLPINYLDVTRVGVTDTSVQVGKISSRDQGNNNNRGSTSAGEDDGANLLGLAEGQAGSASEGERITPGARVQTLTQTNFWQSVEQTIRSIVGDEAGRMVMANPQAGLVVVRALPRELRAVKEFLQLSERRVKQQVVLETKILEVRLDNEFESGINWNAISGQLSLSQVNTAQDSLSSILFDSSSTQESVISTVLNVTDITKLLKLLERQGQVQVLSSPRISTVNNQKALIRVGSDEFFVTGISNSTTSSASSIVNTPEVLLDSFFSGIALDVTPQIAEDGEVILHVHPIITEVQDQIKEIDVAGELFSLPLALRQVRESDSIVKARSGQVVVLGGLMQESSGIVKTQRAFLGKIPIVNLLFKSRENNRRKTELVILMQPIVVGHDTWNDQIQDYSKRIDSLNPAPAHQDDLNP